MLWDTTSYEGLTVSYRGDMSYVGVNKSNRSVHKPCEHVEVSNTYVGLTKSYVGDNISYVKILSPT